MPRSPTNSLILTNLDDSLVKNPKEIVSLISSRNYNVELVTLPGFGRIIVICISAIVASSLRDYLLEALGSKASVSFSMRDNNSRLLDDNSWLLEAKDIDFLELPSEDGSRRFLISPPLSPQSEWNDFDKVEEGPNKKAVYSPDELSHLLWDRLGGFESSHVRKYQDGETTDDEKDEESDITKTNDNEAAIFDLSTKPEVLFEDIENGAPAIVIDRVSNQKRSTPVVLPKTAIPPPL
ncbi:hypothetical protein JCM33374_g5702 [Metschnikowia sp. JCM 33374]|nr:hypothetical protein JCM33374_g5702 [Metschnikowia sp. JCM 33374]